MATEQFSLCWDNFHKNMSTGMSSLLENEDLVDVTIAVEGQYLKAHKMVLSVCSPYFRELFKVNPCKHPIVFMKDVSYIAMSDLLQFMYQGEVQVSQDNLATFIKTAEALQIKGLTGDGNGLNECESDTNETSKPTETESAKPNLKVKKQFSSSPAPSAKRQKLTTKEPHTVTEINEKKRPASPTTETSQEELISFKMEPYDQSQSITLADDASDNAYSEDQLDDQTLDDCTEDYTMIEEEEPKPGTSADISTSHSSIAGVTSDLATSEGQENEEEPEEAAESLLSARSVGLYERTFGRFKAWCVENNKETETYTENVLMSYFLEKSNEYKSSTMWAQYSMVKSCIMTNYGIDIGQYKKLLDFLKKNSDGYKAKGKVLTKEQIHTFLTQANDDEYLMAKIVLIFGIAGACRTEELTMLDVNDIEDVGGSLIVKIPKNLDRPRKESRTFVVTNDEHINMLGLYRKYAALRPSHTNHTRFFLYYKHGRCSIQPMGKNTVGKIPCLIATYLGLPEPTSYTGHCLRRSSVKGSRNWS